MLTWFTLLNPIDERRGLIEQHHQRLQAERDRYQEERLALEREHAWRVRDIKNRLYGGLLELNQMIGLPSEDSVDE